MPIVPSVQIGPPLSMAQNVIYALPPRAVRVLSTQTLEITAGTTGGSYVAISAATTGADLTGAFVKNTNSTTAVAIFRTY